jgi:hypothetical protein
MAKEAQETVATVSEIALPLTRGGQQAVAECAGEWRSSAFGV